MFKYALLLSLSLTLPSLSFATSPSRLEITPVADTPLVTGGDLRHAKLSGQGDQTLLLVELAPEAAARVHAYTASHVDGRLAILVDGQPVMAPRIRVPLDDRFQIGPFAHAEAERLAALINGGASAGPAANGGSGVTE